MVSIIEYNNAYQSSIVNLILHIQQNEFGVEVTLQDQPDLMAINDFYRKGKGNFWIAVENEKLLGTVGLIDMQDGNLALRKMFVEANSRGKEKSVALLLLQTVLAWCKQKGVKNIYLGTVEILKAAHRFYEKNGFVKIEAANLPVSFPRMAVDTLFYQYSFVQQQHNK